MLLVDRACNDRYRTREIKLHLFKYITAIQPEILPVLKSGAVMGPSESLSHWSMTKIAVFFRT